MCEKVIQLEDGGLFTRHTTLERDRPVILFIHGPGESGLCFKEAR